VNKSVLFPSHLRKGIIFFVLLITIGTIFYSHVESWQILDALYFSVVSLTTVGYGDLHPTHEITKIFTMLYILIGVGLLLYMIGTITHCIIKRNEKEIDHLEEQIKRLEETIKSSHLHG
jgi:voltage-gated potassium channel